jgi:hypothetical protein
VSKTTVGPWNPVGLCRNTVWESSTAYGRTRRMSEVQKKGEEVKEMKWKLQSLALTQDEETRKRIEQACRHLTKAMDILRR